MNDNPKTVDVTLLTGKEYILFNIYSWICVITLLAFACLGMFFFLYGKIILALSSLLTLSIFLFFKTLKEHIFVLRRLIILENKIDNLLEENAKTEIKDNCA
jgi:hypothetical protein